MLLFGAVAVIQSAILVLVVTAPGIGKPAPAVLGLAVSALARTSDQVIMLLAMTLMAQLVLAGGFIPVTDRPLFETAAWLTPGRWGCAATASTADLNNLVAGIANDQHWSTPRRHGFSTWPR